MPPPPVTPSPHRFLAKPQQISSSAKSSETSTDRSKAKAFTTPAPGPRKPAPQFTHSATSAQTTQTQQFAKTPRFNYARPPSSKRPRLDDEQRFATPRRFVSETAQPDIEDERDDDDDNDDYLEDHHGVHDPNSHGPKRPAFLPAQAPVVNTPASQIKDPEPPSPLPHRPVFLHPTSPAKAAAEPLPEAFSPHRRGQKFVPGGMASEVRQWILDTSQHTKRSSLRGDMLSRVHVMESKGNASEGLVLVKGVIDGREVRLLLPGAGKVRHMGDEVPVGSVVGIKGPTWDVVLEDKVWAVAADWQVMRGIV